MSRATTATGMLFYFFHIVDEQGIKRYPEVELLSFAKAKADRAAAELLGLAAGDGVYRIRNRLSLAGTPVIIDDITLPVAAFPGLTERQFRHRTSTIYNLYQEAFGISVVRASERLRATLADAETAAPAVDRPRLAAAPDPPDRALLQRGADRASDLAGRHDALRVFCRYRQADVAASSSRVSFASFFAQLLNGLAGASALFLVAAGLTLIFGVTRVVNFAHGSLYMLGAFIAYSLVAAFPRGPLGFWGAVLLAPLVVGADRRSDRGAVVETHLRRAGIAPASAATFGIVLIIRDAALLVWGAEDLLGPRAPGLSGALAVFGRVIPTYDLPARRGPARAARAVGVAQTNALRHARPRGDREPHPRERAWRQREHAVHPGVRARILSCRTRRRAAAFPRRPRPSAWTSRSSPRRSSSPSPAAWARFLAHSSRRSSSASPRRFASRSAPLISAASRSTFRSSRWWRNWS